jgi:hypothetical protein
MAKKKLNASELKIGQKIKYGAFSEITFQGIVEDNGEELVVMQDGFGNTKRVFKYLFEKYAIIV